MKFSSSPTFPTNIYWYIDFSSENNVFRSKYQKRFEFVENLSFIFVI